MTDFKRIKIPAETLALVDAEAEATGAVRWKLIDYAIRSRFGGGDIGSGAEALNPKSAMAPEPSTPPQIDATPIEEYSERSTEYSTQDWCKYGKENRHQWATITRADGDMVRCDLCRLPESVTAPPLSLVTDLASRMEL